jgi:two-component system response regulator ChvI
LLVDNEPDVLLTEKIVLEQYGFKVDSFTDPFIALEYFRANVYWMIILDIKMPTMNGFELYKEIRKIEDKVRVCFMTAGDMNYYRGINEIFPALDNNCYIQKPIENETLIERLNRI